MSLASASELMLNIRLLYKFVACSISLRGTNGDWAQEEEENLAREAKVGVNHKAVQIV